jgi:NAD(P)-dependent dehydrogenase (short-subunit alcohol dehydrogenase family)
MEGKVILITGGNSGIGFATAAEAIRQNAKQVIILGRDEMRVKTAVSKLGERAVAEIADISSLSSIDAFIARAKAAYPVIDVLINNAGTFVPTFSKTTENFEITLASNVIGCAHLTYGLLPSLSASPHSRIVILSSGMVHQSSSSAILKRFQDIGGVKDNSTTLATYAESKVLISLWGQALQIALRNQPQTSHILVASCDPGAVNSGIANKTQAGLFTSVLAFVFPLISKTPELGAVPVIFCATSSAIKDHGGDVWTEGPNVKLMKLKSYFNSSNRDLAFKGINDVIKSTGRSVPL